MYSLKSVRGKEIVGIFNIYNRVKRKQINETRPSVKLHYIDLTLQQQMIILL